MRHLRRRRTAVLSVEADREPTHEVQRAQHDLRFRQERVSTLWAIGSAMLFHPDGQGQWPQYRGDLPRRRARMSRYLGVLPELVRSPLMVGAMNRIRHFLF